MQIGVGVCEICCTSWQRPLCLVPYLFFSETCIACWFSPSLLFPQWGLLPFIRPYNVRWKFSLRAAYFRQVLPPVRGLPTLWVLCLIRLPKTFGYLPYFPKFGYPTWLYGISMPLHHLLPWIFSDASSHATTTYPGFNGSEITVFFRQKYLGPPEFYSISLPACHGLRTPVDLHIQAICGWSCIAFGER